MTRVKSAPRPSLNKAISQASVARLAGVARSTVSMSLSNDLRIAHRTRIKVQEAARAIGYDQNTHIEARRMGARGAGRILPYHSIGVAWSSWSKPVGGSFFQLLLSGIIEGAWAAGSSVNLFSVHEETEVVSARVAQIDGLILPLANKSCHEFARRLGKPLMGMLAAIDDPQVADVTVDNARVIQLAFEHLWSLGHRRIGYLAPPTDTKSAVERWVAYCRCLSDAGLPYCADHVVLEPYIGFRETGGMAMAQLWRRPSRPTAVIVYNDLMAMGTLDAAASMGIVVPRDLSIVSIDGIPEVELVRPALTHVSINIPEIGRLAATRLAGFVADNTYDPAVVRLEPTLCVRGSTVPPLQA